MGGLLHLVQGGGDCSAQSPPRCTKCNIPHINGQCTNFVLFDVALQLPLISKVITNSKLAVHHVTWVCPEAQFPCTGMAKHTSFSNTVLPLADEVSVGFGVHGAGGKAAVEIAVCDTASLRSASAAQPNPVPCRCLRQIVQLPIIVRPLLGLPVHQST